MGLRRGNEKTPLKNDGETTLELREPNTVAAVNVRVRL